MESMASPPVSKVLPVRTPLTYPFPVPDVNVVMLTPRLRLKPRLLPTTMEVTTAVDTDTPTTDTDTVWAVTTDMDSPTPVSPPARVRPGRRSAAEAAAGEGESPVCGVRARLGSTVKESCTLIRVHKAGDKLLLRLNKRKKKKKNYSASTPL